MSIRLSAPPFLGLVLAAILAGCGGGQRELPAVHGSAAGSASPDDPLAHDPVREELRRLYSHCESWR
ncbi:MAG: hypothetical protein OEY14_07535, partial [Myxococcales bacterium]|nr:hypothetical protein [Myxococcales bacterium]